MLASVKLSHELKNANRIMNQRMQQMYRKFLNEVSLKDSNFKAMYQKEVFENAKDPIDILDSFVGTKSIDIQQIYHHMLMQNGFRIKDKVLSSIDLISSCYPEFPDLDSVEKLPGISEVCANQYPWFVVKTLENTYFFLPIGEIYLDDVKEISSLHQKLEPGYSNFYSLSNGYNPYQLGNLSYACHFAAEHFSLLHPDFYATTALCPHIFDGFYWFHSYNETKDGSYVVDIANGMIMKKEDFHFLLEPIVLDCTLGEDILNKKAKILKESNSFIQACVCDNSLKGFAYYEFDQMNVEKQEDILKRIRCIEKD